MTDYIALARQVILATGGDLKRLDEAASVIEASIAPAASSWQLIETAKKDGSRTLIAWLTINNEWRFSFAKWHPDMGHYCLEDRDAYVGARYWMPLGMPDDAQSVVLTEVAASDAPCWYEANQANAWANGYNTAIATLGAMQLPPSLSEGGR